MKASPNRNQGPGALAALALGAALVASCQRAPEEPVAVRASSDAVVRSPPPPSTAEAPFTPSPNRCVEPMKPAKPVLPGVDLRCPPDPDRLAPPMQTVRIEFPDTGRTGVALEAEVARTPYEHERGLMFRTSMGADHGMLFRMNERIVHEFWMRNTCIPLDMLFIDGDGLIVGALENVPTMNEDKRAVSCASRYVLEANAGWIRSHGVKPGQRATIPREATLY